MLLNHYFLLLEFDLRSKIHLLWGLSQNLHQLLVDLASAFFFFYYYSSPAKEGTATISLTLY